MAEVGKATGSVNHFTIFAILGEVSSPAPAAFGLGNLSISPSTSKVWEPVTFITRTGEEVTISVDVNNNGGQDGTYTATLMINGVAVDEKEVGLSPGETQKVVFMVTENEPGVYTVEIGDLSGEFESLLWLNWWLIGGLSAAFILLGWLAWYYGRRRALSRAHS